MASNTKPGALYGTPQGMNAVKGLLILCVVFGHMHAVQFELRPVYDLIYIFHVAGFLLLPFLIPSPKLSANFLATRAVRYVVPFLWFFTVSSVLFYVVFLRGKGVPLITELQNYALGLLVAGTHTLDAASGLKLFWFLPALLTLTILRACWSSASHLQRMVLLTATILVTLFAGDFGDWRHYVPWGLIIAAFVFPLGLLTEHFFKGELPFSDWTRALLPASAIILLMLSWQAHVAINLGDLTLYGALSAPAMLGLYLATMLVVVLAIIQTQGFWARMPGLAFVGSLSLPVYLVHALVNQVVDIALRPKLGLPPLVDLWLTFPLVVAISLLASCVMFKFPLFRLALFPRNGAELRTWATSLPKFLGISYNPMIRLKND